MAIDAHAHLYHCDDQAVVAAKEAGLVAIVNICTERASLEHGLELQKKQHDFPIYTTAATTPHDVEKDGEAFFPYVAEAALKKQLIAIGETGLDYYYMYAKKEVQQEFFQRYIDLAELSALPLVIHCRDAFSDFFSIIDERKKAPYGVLHCFTGTKEEARKLLDRNWYISFSGIVTFLKSRDLQDIAQFVPIDRIVIETDAPYLAPQAVRGKKNQPAYLLHTAQFLAEKRKMDVVEFIQHTKENTKKLFQLEGVN